MSSEPFVSAFALSAGADVRPLQVCDNIVKRMHGTLQYESVLGVGTIARIAVPLRLVPAPLTPNRPFPVGILGIPRTRVISDELKSMLDPRSIMADAETAREASAIEREARSPSPAASVFDVARPLPLPDVDPSTPLTGFDRTLKCLVVDDNRIARRILTTFLVAKVSPGGLPGRCFD